MRGILDTDFSCRWLAAWGWWRRAVEICR